MKVISTAGMMAVALATSLWGCENPRRIPYIPPELAGWTRPYRGSTKLQLHLFKTGTLEVAAALLGEGVLEGTKTLDLLAFVITHQGRGAVVFDTGLSPDFYTDEPPTSPAVKLLGARAEEGSDLLSQMQSAGIDIATVSTVVVSSLHFYRAGGVELFPGAVVVTSGEEKEAAQSPGFISFYHPQDFDHVERWRLLSFRASSPYGTLKSHLDLFGDDSLIVLPTPGQSAGGLSLLVRLASRPVLLIGDLAWTAQSVRFAQVPRLAANRDKWWDSVWRVKRFAELAPEILLLPGCDLKPVNQLQQLPRDITVHRAPDPLKGNDASTKLSLITPYRRIRPTEESHDCPVRN